MKTLICLLATACVCNATFLSLLSGLADDHADSYSSRDHGQAHSYHHHQSHGFGKSPEVIKVILDQRNGGGHANAGGYSYASGHGYGSSGYGGYGGDAQIIKVINQNTAARTSAHRGYTYSASNSPAYVSNDFGSFSSQFSAILPQILELILEDNAGHSGHGGHSGYTYGAGSALSSQLTTHFGHSGTAFITRSNGKSNSYYSGGHVVEKGVIHITPVKGEPVHAVPLRGSPTHVFSSHSPPVHGW